MISSNYYSVLRVTFTIGVLLLIIPLMAAETSAELIGSDSLKVLSQITDPKIKMDQLKQHVPNLELEMRKAVAELITGVESVIEDNSAVVTELNEIERNRLEDAVATFQDFLDGSRDLYIYIIGETFGEPIMIRISPIFKLASWRLTHPATPPLQYGLNLARVATPPTIFPIVFVADTWEEHITINDSCTPLAIIGIGGGLDGSEIGAGPGITINSAEYSLVSNLDISGFTADRGGGVYMGNSNAILLLNRFHQNIAWDMGGGLFCKASSGHPIIIANKINGNSAPKGAGIAIYQDSHSTLVGNTIRDNNASAMGGGVYFRETEFTQLVGNRIFNNQQTNPDAGGGGIAVDTSLAIIIANSITNNSSAADGGGIYVQGQTMGIRDIEVDYSLIWGNTIVGNNAAGEGGGIALDTDASAWISYNTIGGVNTADLGGGLACDECEQATIISGNKFQNNTAFVSGGGLWLHKFDNDIPFLCVSNNDIFRNTANISGGGVYMEDGSVRLKNNRIKQNTSLQGGGIYCSGDERTPHINDNRIYANSADQGGAVCISDGSGVEIYENEFTGNEATTQGGALYITDDDTNPEVGPDNHFNSNSALNGLGGAIYIGYPANPIVYEDTLYFNRAINGGAIYCGSSSAQITENFFYLNQSSDNGGALYLPPGSSPQVSSNQWVQNVAGVVFPPRSVQDWEPVIAAGGAIYATGVDDNLVIQGNRFLRNAATDGAAVALVDGTSPLISNNYFSENMAHWDTVGEGLGGAILADGCAPVISADSLIWNTAVFGGGIACVDAGDTQIDGNVFQWNIADYNKLGAGIGGALYLKVNALEASVKAGASDLNLFIENIAENGGAIGIEEGGNLLSQKNIFTSNHTDYNWDGSGLGGAIFIRDADSRAEIGGDQALGEGNLFEMNTAGSPGTHLGNGGAIAAVSGAELTVTGNIFDNHNACTHDGGGVYLRGNGTSLQFGGANSDEIINHPDNIEQYGNVVQNNNTNVKIDLLLPEIQWPVAPIIWVDETDSLTLDLGDPCVPEPPDTTVIYEDVSYQSSYCERVETASDYYPETYMFTAETTAGTQIINVTDPENPQVICSISTNDQIGDLAIGGDRLFLAEGAAGIRMFDLTPLHDVPESFDIEQLDQFQLDEAAVVGLDADGDMLYALTDHNHLLYCSFYDDQLEVMRDVALDDVLWYGFTVHEGLLYDCECLPICDPCLRIYQPVLDGPEGLVLLNSYPLDGAPVDLTIQDELAAVLLSFVDPYPGTQYRLLDISDPQNIEELPVMMDMLPGWPQAITLQGSTCYFTTESDLVVHNYFDGLLQIHETTSPVLDMEVVGDYVHLANGYGGFQVFSFESGTPVATIDTVPIMEELNIPWLEWVPWSPVPDWTYDVPPIPDECLELESRVPEFLMRAYIHRPKWSFYNPVLRDETDSLVTINGGFLAVVDSADAIVEGNLIGGSGLEDANIALGYGGGIYLNNAGDELRIGPLPGSMQDADLKNFIRGNVSAYGGAIAAVNSSRTAEIYTNCIGGAGALEGNQARYWGGGICVDGYSVIVEQNIIQFNHAGIGSIPAEENDGFGGGIALLSSAATIRDNWLIHNFSSGNAGGIGIDQHILENQKIEILNNTLSENRGLRPLRPYSLMNLPGIGDEIFIGAFSDSCLFRYNIIDHLASYETYAIFADSTLVTDQNLVHFAYNDVWNHTGKRYGGMLAEQTDFNGNISQCPLFVNPVEGDFNLAPNSPAITMGWNPEPGSSDQTYTEYLVPGSFPTITAAMAAAQYGDRVIVLPEYDASSTETFPIQVTNGVILTGTAFLDTLDLNLIPHTVLEGDGSSTILQLENTDRRTVIAALTIRNGDPGIEMLNSGGVFYSNLLYDHNMGLSIAYEEEPGVMENSVFMDHNTIVDGIEIEYPTGDRFRYGYEFPVKLQFGPVFSHNIGSIQTNIDDIPLNPPVHFALWMNDLWPNSILGYYDEWGGVSDGNINENPDFVDENEADYHLGDGSPCFLLYYYTGMIGALYEDLVPAFAPTPASGEVPLEVAFDNNSAHTCPFEQIDYYWDFGNGSTSNEDNPTCTYSNSGVYSVELIMRDRYAAKTLLEADLIQAYEQFNQPPVLAEIGDYMIVEDSILQIPLEAEDPEADPLFYDAWSYVDEITMALDEDLLTLTPAADWYGSADITVTVSDGALADTSIFQLTVTPVNDPPLLEPIPDQELLEDSELTLTLTAADIDNDELFFSAYGNCDEIQVAVIEDDMLHIVPDPNWFGTTSIVVVVDDLARRLTDSRIFNLDVLAVNDMPVLTEIEDQETPMNTPIAIELYAWDADGDELVYTAETECSQISLNLVNSTLTLTPNEGWSGIATISVIVSDSSGDTDQSVFSVTVLPVTPEVLLDLNEISYSGQMLSVSMNSPQAVSAFEFRVTGDPDLLTLVATSGGMAETAGFQLIITAGGLISGSHPTGGAIPSGAGILTWIHFNGFGNTELCLDEAAFWDAEGGTLVVDMGPCAEILAVPGDADDDGQVNVVDVVQIVALILSGDAPDEYLLYVCDMTGDGMINVVDLVIIIDLILNPVLSRDKNIGEAEVTYNEHLFRIRSVGAVAGLQINHQGSFTQVESCLSPPWQVDYSEQVVLIYNLEGKSLTSGELFRYRGMVAEPVIQAVSWEGPAASAIIAECPTTWQLHPAYPNPFNSVTQLDLVLPEDLKVLAKIYNVNGQLVEILINRQMTAGYHTIVWNAENTASGVYFLQVVSGKYLSTQKLLLMK